MESNDPVTFFRKVLYCETIARWIENNRQSVSEANSRGLKAWGMSTNCLLLRVESKQTFCWLCLSFICVWKRAKQNGSLSFFGMIPGERYAQRISCYTYIRMREVTVSTPGEKMLWQQPSEFVLTRALVSRMQWSSRSIASTKCPFNRTLLTLLIWPRTFIMWRFSLLPSVATNACLSGQN